MSFAVMVLLTIVGCIISCMSKATEITTQPNFLILFVDDWGYGDMGANWPRSQGFTPNMDKLAAGGIRFTDFHVGASVCSVSRAALLTGRLGLRNGVTHNFEDTSVAGLPRTELTIAELLKPTGYKTGIIGKWHLGTTPGYHPTYRGFDSYIGLPYSVDMGCTEDRQAHDTHPRLCNGNYRPSDKNYKLPLPMYHSTSANCSGHGSITGSCNMDIAEQPVNFSKLSDRYTLFAENFISNATNENSPFFLYVPFSHIHTPQYVMPQNIGRSNVTGRAGFFFDSLLEVDESIGKILAAVKAAGQEENTLVFLTGDNGPWEVKCNLSGSAGPFTGLWQKNEGGGGSSSKTTLWEGGHRMVGVASMPSRINARVSNATLSSMDFLPTFLSVAGVQLPSDRVFDGIDISHVLFDGSNVGHETLFHPNSGASGPDGQLDAVRYKNWKAIYQTGGAPDCSGNKGTITRHDPPLLFDLSIDPAEEHALDTSQQPYNGVIQTITDILKAQIHSVNTTFRSVANYSTDVSQEPCAHIEKNLCFESLE